MVRFGPRVHVEGVLIKLTIEMHRYHLLVTKFASLKSDKFQLERKFLVAVESSPVVDTENILLILQRGTVEHSFDGVEGSCSPVGVCHARNRSV